MTHYWLGGPEGRSARGFWGTCYSQQRERKVRGEREEDREGEEGRGGERRGEALCSILGRDVWNRHSSVQDGWREVAPGH